MTRRQVRTEKICKYCDTEYLGTSQQVYCSKDCRRRGHYSTKSQYDRISGNWEKYVARLMYYGGRKRDKLSSEIILDRLEKQDYKCALSGVPLTCILENGTKTWTNVSIDRIEAGGPYTADNIQLVCRALNSWRADLPIQDFVEWCRLVVAHADQDKEDTCHA